MAKVDKPFKLTELRVKGLRSLKDVTLRLDGLQVLIGDNGSGKSSILEALELLRKSARSSNFVAEWLIPHHGLPGEIITDGQVELRLGIAMARGAESIDYELSILRDATGTHALVNHERLVRGRGELLFERRAGDEEVKLLEPGFQRAIHGHFEGTVMGIVGTGGNGLIDAVRAALDRLIVHVPFDTSPAFVAKGSNLDLSPMRRTAPPEPVEFLRRRGLNVVSAFHTLRSRTRDWPRLLHELRAGLGDRLEDVETSIPASNVLQLGLRFHGQENAIPASQLSDGQLSYLGFVAMKELGGFHSALAFDEPETHLHPALATRVAWLFDAMSEETPIIIATHSERFLNALRAPAESAVLCELNVDGHTELKRPDEKKLSGWLKEFGGLGDIRREGLESQVYTSDSSHRGVRGRSGRAAPSPRPTSARVGAARGPQRKTGARTRTRRPR